jgi:AcrR family transcriptional regulator
LTPEQTAVLSHDAPPLSARRAQTRDRLMAAATNVFAERGVNGASVEEICEAAGFTRGAFYSNFADKDALVLAMIEAGVAAQYAAAEGALGTLAASAPGSAPEELVMLTLSRFDALGPRHDGGRSSREAVLVQQELMLHAARVPALRAPYAAFVQACVQQLKGLITDALAAAGLEFTLPFDEALDLLNAAHDHAEVTSLFLDEPAPTLQRMVLAITRPIAR